MNQQAINVSLITKHQKAEFIGKTLSDALGWQLTEISAFDTDSLGTFSGEIERNRSAEECAIYKAQLAVDQGGAFGLGSEGSFAPDPWGMMTINQELLACVDQQLGLVAVGVASQPVDIDVASISCDSLQQCDNDKSIAQFIEALPQGQAAILACKDEQGRVLDAIKGLDGAAQIYAALNQISANCDGSLIELSYDLRAMHCPQRQQTLVAAAVDLARRMNSRCPKCQTPNFVDKQTELGLPCELCGQPTAQIIASIARCDSCGFTHRTEVADTKASAVHCQFCNP